MAGLAFAARISSNEYLDRLVSEILIISKVELARVVCSVLCNFDTSSLVIADSLLKKVGFTLQGDHIHPLEGVLNVVVLGYSELEKKSIGNEFDVLVHQSRIHTDELNWQRISDEMTFNLDSFRDNFKDSLIGQFVVEMLVQKAGEVGMHTFVSRDQFVGECETGHQSSLLDPEDCAEATREENSFNSCERNDSLSKGV